MGWVWPYGVRLFHACPPAHISRYHSRGIASPGWVYKVDTFRPNGRYSTPLMTCASVAFLWQGIQLSRFIARQKNSLIGIVGWIPRHAIYIPCRGMDWAKVARRVGLFCCRVLGCLAFRVSPSDNCMIPHPTPYCNMRGNSNFHANLGPSGT